MVRTYGLTHIALAVRDPEASLTFYQRVLGVVPVYQTAEFIQAQTPGTRDVLVFEQSSSHVGELGGVVHFGRGRCSCSSCARRSRTDAGLSPTAIAARSDSRTNPSSVACRASAISGRQ